MTRILHLICSADPATGGALEVTRLLAKVWARRGHTQDLLTLDPPGSQFLPDYAGRIISVGPERRKGVRGFYVYAPALVPWLRRHVADYDLVIVSGLWRYISMGAAKVLAGGDTPYFVMPHGMLDPWFRQAYPRKHAMKQLIWWYCEGRLLARADKVLFTCAEERLRARGSFWPYRVDGAVVGCGTEDVPARPDAQIAAFRAAVPAVSNRRFLLFLSRVHEKKGCDLLVGAFAAIAGQHPDLDLVIAGPDLSGLTARLQAQAHRLGVAARVHFPGMLAGDAKFGAFRAAEAFALCSHQENFGVVVAEAMACGTPVLISKQVNIWREALADGAALVEPDTPDGAHQLFGRFLAMDAAARTRLRHNARACFERRYDIEGVATGLMALIERHRRPSPLRDAARLAPGVAGAGG